MCSRCCWDRRSTPTGVIPSHDASSRGCENRAKSPISAISPSAVNVEIPRNRVRIFHLPGPPLAAGDLAQPRVERGELALDPVQVGSAAATRPGPAGSRCGGCSRGSVSRAMSSRASLIPVRAGDRVKTDRRDAKKLVALYRAGLLRFVYPPTVELEGAPRPAARAGRRALRADGGPQPGAQAAVAARADLPRGQDRVDEAASSVAGASAARRSARPGDTGTTPTGPPGRPACR